MIRTSVIPACFSAAPVVNPAAAADKGTNLVGQIPWRRLNVGILFR